MSTRTPTYRSFPSSSPSSLLTPLLMYLPTYQSPDGSTAAKNMPLLESVISFTVAATTVFLETVVHNGIYVRDLLAYYFGGRHESDKIKLEGGVRLRSYDFLGLHYSLWLLGSPSIEHLQRLFDWNLTSRHADIGVATGYWARHSNRLAHLLETQPPSSGPVQYDLFDANPSFLNYASYEIAATWPHTQYPLSTTSNLVSYLDPETIKDELKGQYDSCMAMLLLHRASYPVEKEGDLGAIKAEQLFKMAAELMKPGARFFGVTVLPPHAITRPTSYLGRLRYLRGKAAQDHLRRRGVLHNEHDSVDKIMAALGRVGFDEASIKVKVVNFVMAWEATLVK